jgi:acyl-CoA thioester hydrolase
VVASNQIAYLRPAFAMEEVVIQSQLLSFDDTSLKVELRMYNRERTKVKAMMWSNYVHFNLIEQKREKQQAEMLALFSEVAAPVPEKDFEERAAHWKKFNIRN